MLSNINGGGIGSSRWRVLFRKIVYSCGIIWSGGGFLFEGLFLLVKIHYYYLDFESTKVTIINTVR